MKLAPTLILSLSCLTACGVGGGPASTAPIEAKSDWVGIWGAALHQPANTAADTSFRMIVHPTLAAETIRVRFASPYGTAPVIFSNVHAALRTNGPAIDAATDHPVTFRDGADTLTLAPGEEVFPTRSRCRSRSVTTSPCRSM